MKRQRFYYKDELTDEFSGISCNTSIIDHNYKYFHKNIFYYIGKFFVYNIVMKLVALCYSKLKFHVKYVNGDLLKKYNGETVFVYGNHTNMFHDGYGINSLTLTKDVSFIVSPDNVSQQGTKTFMAMVGCLPIPNKLSGMRHFKECLANICNRPGKKGRIIVVYPEAHIWPYYTKIRSFSDASFQYPLEYATKVFSMTTTYQLRKNSNKVNIKVYIDGPYVADTALTRKVARKKLRDQVYAKMVERSKKSTYDVNEFIKISDDVENTLYSRGTK